MSKERAVRCKACGVLFLVGAGLGDRLIALNRPTCPRCPECERRAKRHTARSIRAHYHYQELCKEIARRDSMLRFSRGR